MEPTIGLIQPSSFGRHFVEKSKQTKAQDFLVAVEEAVAEYNRGLPLAWLVIAGTLPNFRRTDVQGFLKVDVSGYELGGLYSMDQIKKAREDYRLSETLSFVQQLAMNPGFDALGIVDYMKNAAKVLTYRRAVFNEFNETYTQAFGVQPGGFGDSMTVSNRRGKLMAQGILEFVIHLLDFDANSLCVLLFTLFMYKIFTCHLCPC